MMANRQAKSRVTGRANKGAGKGVTRRTAATRDAEANSLARGSGQESLAAAAGLVLTPIDPSSLDVRARPQIDPEDPAEALPVWARPGASHAMGQGIVQDYVASLPMARMAPPADAPLKDLTRSVPYLVTEIDQDLDNLRPLSPRARLEKAYFMFDDARAGQMSHTLFSRGSLTVFVVYPQSQFEMMHRLLQTERPVYVAAEFMVDGDEAALVNARLAVIRQAVGQRED